MCRPSPVVNPPVTSPDNHKITPLWFFLFIAYYLLVIFVFVFVANRFGNILFYPSVFLTPVVIYYIYRRFVNNGTIDDNRTQIADLFRTFSHSFFGGGCFAIIFETVAALILSLLFIGSKSLKTALSDEDYDGIRHNWQTHVYVFLTAFAIAGVIEEATKGMILQHCTKLYLSHPNYLHRNDVESYVWFGICSGLGFGTMEGVIYVCVYGGLYGLLGQFILWLIRVFVTIPFHTVTGFMWGVQLCRRDISKQPLSWVQMGFRQVLWHGFYDFVEMEYYLWEGQSNVGLVILGCVIAVVFVIAMAFVSYRDYKSYKNQLELIMLVDEENVME